MNPEKRPLRLLVVGATSAIAKEVCRVYASKNAEFFLVARNAAKLEGIKNDLSVRGASAVNAMQLDLSRALDSKVILPVALSFLDEIDIAVLATGVLPDQKRCEEEARAFEESWRVNFSSAATLALSIAAHMAERDSSSPPASLVVISSVAGDRGRASNYIYGSAKAALSTFLQGLRARLHAAGIQVLTVKPGFVDTPMTANMKKNPLFVSPEYVGAKIVRAIEKRKDVIYVPWFWWFIMATIKAIPERLFKRLKM